MIIYLQKDDLKNENLKTTCSKSYVQHLRPVDDTNIRVFANALQGLNSKISSTQKVKKRNLLFHKNL